MGDVQTNLKSWEKKYTIEADKMQEDFKHASKEKIEELLEFDKEKEIRTETKQEEMGTFFRERYSVNKAPEKTFENNIKKAVGFLRPEKKWGWMDDMGKRISHAVKQVNRQRRLFNEGIHTDQIFKEKRQYIEASISEEQAKVLWNEFPTDSEALRHWGVMEVETVPGKKKVQDNIKYLASNRINFRASCMQEILKEVKSFAKPENFTFKNDDEFIRDYAEKYDLLCKGASAQTFLRKLEQMMVNNQIEPESLIEAKAAIDFCVSLRGEYEKRRELISSPYYALLTRDDIRKFLDRNGEVDNDKVDEVIGERMTEEEKEELDRFLERYSTLQNSECGKNADLVRFYGKKLKAAQTYYAEIDANKIENMDLRRLPDFQINFDSNFDSNLVLSAYARELETEAGKYEAVSQAGFLKNIPIVFAGGNLIDGMGPEHIEGFELILAQILEKGTIGSEGNEQQVKPEDLEELKKLAGEVSDMKREYIQMNTAVNSIEGMLHSSVDLSNPKFKDLPQARIAEKLKKLYDAHIWDEKKQAAVRRCGYYVNHIQRIMESIVKKGYRILPEQGAWQDQKKAEKALEKELTDYRNSRQLKEGQKPEDIQFPAVTVNGKQYCTYGYNGMAKSLEGQMLQFKKKENAEKAGELFDQYEKLLKELAVMKGLYGSENGYKRFLLMCETNRINEKMKPVEDQIMKLCLEEFPEKFTETSDDHFAKRKLEIYGALNGVCEESEQHHLYMVYEAQKKGSLGYIWHVDTRPSRAMVNFLAYMERDKKEKTDYLQFYHQILYSYKPEELTTQQKEEKIVAAKKIMNILLQYDIKSLAIKDPKELLGGKFYEQELFLLFCVETEPLIKAFKALMEDPEAKEMMEKKGASTSFTKEQYQEILARMDFFENVSVVFNNYRAVVKAPAASKFNLEKLMKVDSKQIDLMRVFIENRKFHQNNEAVSPLPYMNQADAKEDQLDTQEIIFINSLVTWKRALEKNGGYHFEDPVKTFQQYVEANKQKK